MRTNACANRLRTAFSVAACALTVCLAVAACGSLRHERVGAMRPPAGAQSSPAPGQDEQAQIIQAQANHERKVEVTVSGRVAKMLPEDTRGLPHERFLLQLDNGTRVLVAHDTRMAPRVPLSNGDFVRIHGEYIWNDRGGVLHWTHHCANGRHEPGWIEYSGQRYE